MSLQLYLFAHDKASLISTVQKLLKLCPCTGTTNYKHFDELLQTTKKERGGCWFSVAVKMKNGERELSVQVRHVSQKNELPAFSGMVKKGRQKNKEKKKESTASLIHISAWQKVKERKMYTRHITISAHALSLAPIFIFLNFSHCHLHEPYTTISHVFVSAH